ncbi:MAG: formyltransferase family protein [Dehalococcoidia bacterium]
MKLGWFSTGRGEGSLGLLTAALDAIERGDLNADIEFVFCNRERGQAAGSDHFMDVVERNRIPLVTLSSRRFRREHGNRPWPELREDFDSAIINKLAAYNPHISVNAGYMLIAPLLCRVHRMINLHPALPGGPIGMWQQVIWELIEKRASETGAMVHLVTEDVDGGPMLSFCRFGIRGREFDPLWDQAGDKPASELADDLGEDLPLFKAIRQAGLLRERPLLVETLRAIVNQRINVELAFERKPLDLTAEVEENVRRSASAG